MGIACCWRARTRKNCILCDGGRTASMRGHVRGELAKLRKAKSKLDVVYVSHVDNDHITGVLALLEDELQWRIHEHRKKNGINTAPPKVPRPPEIATLWHNAFRDQIKDVDPDDIESLLAAAVPTLNGTGVKDLEMAATELGDLATAVTEALKVSHLLSADLLNIPVNKLPGQAGEPKLLMLRPGQAAFNLGTLKLTIVGPGTKELGDLNKGWNNWLRENEETVKNIRRADEEEDRGVQHGDAFRPAVQPGWLERHSALQERDHAQHRLVDADDRRGREARSHDRRRAAGLRGERARANRISAGEPGRPPRCAQGSAPRLRAQHGRGFLSARFRRSLRVLWQWIERQSGNPK